MSVEAAVLDRAAGFAPAARLLAAWWSRPTAAEVALWDGSWEAAAEVAALLGTGGAAVEALHQAVEAAPAGVLVEEHERLLVGPGRVPCAPYESLWRADLPRREHGRLMASCAVDAARVYRDLGLQVRADAHELPDHLVVEWEAVAHALERGATESAEALLAGHLAGWMPAFCAAVREATEHPFYVTLARLTPDWTAALTA